MKLSKIYSNQDSIFEPIIFNDGFNVVYGDIRLPKNFDKDTHNLGKTTLAKLLDFMFLARRNPKQFLFKHEEKFNGFIFFLELALDDGTYLTIRRSVEENTRIFFKKHTERLQDYSLLVDEYWTTRDIGIENARKLLQGWFSFDILQEYPYRKIIGYLVRTQNDFTNVFKLNKEKGKDANWKPYMADLLGFNGKLAKERYDKLTEVNTVKDKISAISLSDVENINKELSKINNKLLLRQKELVEIQDFINRFNFEEIDQDKINELASSIDDEVANLNMREYSIKNNISRIQSSLDNTTIKFNTKQVESLFNEAKIAFPDQLSKDFNQLIQFNQDITRERKKFLKEELSNLQEELLLVENKLKLLNLKRSDNLKFLSETKMVTKFKNSSKKVAEIQAEIRFLEKQKENIAEIKSLSKGRKLLEGELDGIQEKIQANIMLVNEVEDNTFSKVRIYFNEIISKVFNKEGEITVYLNNQGNLEFDANYQDTQGNNTSESDGHTYGKFLSIAFDLAVARTYLDKKYPKFLYIDGAFEKLDDRKRKLLLEVLRNYSDLGIQIIITAISSEVSGFPINPFSNEEIILTLHDDGKEGRLFKMSAW